MEKRILLKYPNGNYVAIDSGTNYPYQTKSPMPAANFGRVEKALDYRKSFESDNLSVVELEISFKEKVLTNRNSPFVVGSSYRVVSIGLIGTDRTCKISEEEATGYITHNDEMIPVNLDLFRNGKLGEKAVLEKLSTEDDSEYLLAP